MASEGLKEFFAGKTIFVSGATGYIGRLLVAKLLRLGNVKEILICSRPKKDQSAEDRLVKILKGFLFESMSDYDKSFRSKLKVINCDLELRDLGISPSDREYIKNNVDLMIHAAATVHFNEKLRKAIAINVQGAKAMLDLALEVKNLKSYVHVSTAYSNCPLLHIKEKFYQPPIDFNLALEIAESMSDEVVDCLTPKLISPWPNTYTFTKAISEDMVRRYAEKLPITILRPSIVIQTSEDPVAGFSDSMLSFLGVCIGVMAGVIRVIKCDPAASLNQIPADVVVNSILAVAKFRTEQENVDPQKNIFNCVYALERITSLGEGHGFIIPVFLKYPTKRMLWIPQAVLSKAGIKYELLFFFYHCLPAFFIDIGLKFKGTKLRLMKIYAKIYELQNLFYYFMRQTWKFDNDNMAKIYSMMSAQDHTDFPIRIDHKPIEKFAEESIEGLRKYFFKENDEDLRKARRKLQTLQIYKYIAIVVLLVFVVSRFSFFEKTTLSEVID